MKKLLLGAAIALTSTVATAQIADGSVAPDFTGTDQWGNSHTLSDYLSAGKTVILDISATWCGPCWNYHNSHALKDLYNAYGPNGSDEIMVFFVEGDGSTPISELGGGGSSQGDWLNGTPYPMIDAASIATDYQIGYYPTVYRICPDGMGGGTVYEEGQSTVAQLVASIENNCGQSLTGVTNHAEMMDAELGLCGTTGAPAFEFDNFGTNAITSATVELKENGLTVATQNFSGNVAQFAAGTVTFPSMTINGGSTYTAEMTAVNGGAVYNATPDMATTWWNGGEADLTTVSATLTSFAITVDFFTDNYPSETSYEIRNSADQVVATAGPWQPGTDDQWGGGGPDALTTHTNNFTLPSVDDCYSVRFIDAFGDGQQYGTNPAGQFGISIMNASMVEVFNFDPGNFGAQLDRDAAVRTELGSSGIAEFTFEGLNVYPNPASDLVNVVFETAGGDYSIVLADITGRVVASESGNANGNVQVAFPVANLAKGSYLVTISTAAGSQTENVVVK